MASKISRKDYEAAITRGRKELAEPYAVSARYIAHARVLELVYSNGLVLRFDPKEIAALKDLSRTALAHAYVTPGGDGLVFGEDEAAAVSISGLVARLRSVGLDKNPAAAKLGNGPFVKV